MLNKKNGLIILIFALILSTSCKKEFTTIGNNLIDTPHFEGKLYQEAQVRIYDQPVDRVFSSDLGIKKYENLPYAALGFYNDERFGVLKADIATTLGYDHANLNKDLGDGINILGSKLIIPYFSHEEDEAYVLDSVYGDTTLDIGVYELTYLLPTYDPETNLEEPQKFYSDFDFSPYKDTLIGEILGFEVTNEPYYIYKRNDDGSFELDDNDEKIVKDSLSPRMVIDLNNDFFQQKIFDHSGEDILTNPELFRDYFRGIYIEAKTTGETGRMMLMPLDEAEILIEYTYEKPDPETEEGFETLYKEIKLSLGKPRVNHYENTWTSEMQTALENSDFINGDAQIYIKGDAGSEAVIQLFNNSQLRELRRQDWLINQAELYVYVDKIASEQLLAKAQRLLIYNYDTQNHVDDVYFSENINNNNSALNGKLIVDDNGDMFYKFGITRHIRNVIKNDSVNANLALRVIAKDVPGILNQKDMFIDPDAFDPKGIILQGNQSADKPPVLKIYYTDPE